MSWRAGKRLRSSPWMEAGRVALPQAPSLKSYPNSPSPVTTVRGPGPCQGPSVLLGWETRLSTSSTRAISPSWLRHHASLLLTSLLLTSCMLIYPPSRSCSFQITVPPSRDALLSHQKSRLICNMLGNDNKAWRALRACWNLGMEQRVLSFVSFPIAKTCLSRRNGFSSSLLLWLQDWYK
jgi:hypothetical protein